jgi:hypothetical protein
MSSNHNTKPWVYAAIGGAALIGAAYIFHLLTNKSGGEEGVLSKALAEI